MPQSLLKLPKPLHGRIRPHPSYAMRMSKNVGMDWFGPNPGDTSQLSRLGDYLLDPSFTYANKRSAPDVVFVHVIHDQFNGGLVHEDRTLIASFLATLQGPKIKDLFSQINILNLKH